MGHVTKNIGGMYLFGGTGKEWLFQFSDRSLFPPLGGYVMLHYVESSNQPQYRCQQL